MMFLVPMRACSKVFLLTFCGNLDASIAEDLLGCTSCRLGFFQM